MSRDPIVRAITDRMFPELARFEAGEEREAAFQRAAKNSRTVQIILLTLLPAVVAAYVLIGHGHPALTRYLPEFVATLLLPFALVLGYFWLIWRLTGKSIQRDLRRQLVDKGIALCIQCGYDLRGQVEQRCPECGSLFDLPR